MHPRCCRINFGFYSSTLVDKEPKKQSQKQMGNHQRKIGGFLF